MLLSGAGFMPVAYQLRSHPQGGSLKHLLIAHQHRRIKRWWFVLARAGLVDRGERVNPLPAASDHEAALGVPQRGRECGVGIQPQRPPEREASPEAAHGGWADASGDCGAARHGVDFGP